MKMRNRTHRNFLRVMKMVQAKGYDRQESEDLTRIVWDNVEADKGRGNRTAEWFVNQILSKTEYEREYSIKQGGNNNVE